MQLLPMQSSVAIRRMVKGMLSNNVYVLSSQTTSILVDPGCLADELYTQIEDAVKTGKIPPVAGIILTHYHYDHMGAAARMREMLGVKVYASRVDAPYIDGRLPMPTTHRKVELCPVDVELEDDVECSIGDIPFHTMLTPGHSPGSMCFYIAGGEECAAVLVSGDTLFEGTYGRVDFVDGNAKDMRTSLTRLQTLPKSTVVLPGHGNVTTIANEAQNFILALREL